MKPNFSIGAQNGLLEQKHFKALGSAIWLYLWFIDKQPKNTDKVLGGQPVTYQMFATQFPGICQRTYANWLGLIRDGGYITTLRTPRGSVITITKPKKWLKDDVQKSVKIPQSDTQNIAHQNNSDTQNLVSDVQDFAHAEDVQNMAIQYKRNSLKKQLVTTNVVTEFGNSEINKIIGHFENRIGKMPRIKHQRYAAHTLMQRYGPDRVIGAINAVAACRSEQYAPAISTLEALRDRWVDLETFWQRKGKQQARKVLEI